MSTTMALRTPRIIRTGVLGTVESAGRRFGFVRTEFLDMADGNFVSYQLDFPQPGEIVVAGDERIPGDPFGVDLYRKDEGVLTPDEAREWAHALLGAADLADRLNREGAAR